MQLQIFKFQSPEEEQFNELTTVEIEGEVWFVASEVCKILGIKNPRDAVSTLDNDEKNTVGITDGTSGNPNKTIVSESGLYELIFRSNKPEAKKFRKWITKEVIPSIRKKGYYGKIDRFELPNFMIRYRENMHNIPGDHFSVISEMFVRLYNQLEKVGYKIPDKGASGAQMMPDISVGIGFAKFLKDNDSEFFDTHKKYSHTFPDGREVEANMYHIDALPVFVKYINEKWIPEYAKSYFEKRDPLALDYLPKLLEFN